MFGDKSSETIFSLDGGKLWRTSLSDPSMLSTGVGEYAQRQSPISHPAPEVRPDRQPSSRRELDNQKQGPTIWTGTSTWIMMARRTRTTMTMKTARNSIDPLR